MVWLTAVALLVLVAVILVAGPFLNTLLNQTSSLEIHSNPEGANIFINNQLKGQTQCFQRRIPAGSYDLRIEKEGYIPYQRQFILGKHQTASLFVQLEKLKIEPEPAVPAAVVSLLPESALKTSEPELKKEVETSPATIPLPTDSNRRRSTMSPGLRSRPRLWLASRRARAHALSGDTQSL